MRFPGGMEVLKDFNSTSTIKAFVVIKKKANVYFPLNSSFTVYYRNKLFYSAGGVFMLCGVYVYDLTPCKEKSIHKLTCHSSRECLYQMKPQDCKKGSWYKSISHENYYVGAVMRRFVFECILGRQGYWRKLLPPYSV